MSECKYVSRVPPPSMGVRRQKAIRGAELTCLLMNEMKAAVPHSASHRFYNGTLHG